MLSKIFEIAPKITNYKSLLAFALGILIVGYYIYCKYKSQDKGTVRIVVLGVIFLGICFIAAEMSQNWLEDNIYKPRIIVLGVNDMPVKNSKVWSSAGGEAKKISGGWQFNIPEKSLPEDKYVTFKARKETSFLYAEKKVKLTEFNTTVFLKLKSDQTAIVGGIVFDETGDAVSGVHVRVSGYSDEGIVTDSSGTFKIAAHASKDQQVLLRAHKEGYQSTQLWCPAGKKNVRLVIRLKDK